MLVGKGMVLEANQYYLRRTKKMSDNCPDQLDIKLYNAHKKNNNAVAFIADMVH